MLATSCMTALCQKKAGNALSGNDLVGEKSLTGLTENLQVLQDSLECQKRKLAVLEDALNQLKGGEEVSGNDMKRFLMENEFAAICKQKKRLEQFCKDAVEPDEEDVLKHVKDYLSLIHIHTLVNEATHIDSILVEEDRFEEQKQKLNIYSKHDVNVKQLSKQLSCYLFALYELARIISECEAEGLETQNVFAEENIKGVKLVPYPEEMLSQYRDGDGKKREEIKKRLIEICPDAFE